MRKVVHGDEAGSFQSRDIRARGRTAARPDCRDRLRVALALIGASVAAGPRHSLQHIGAALAYRIDCPSHCFQRRLAGRTRQYQRGEDQAQSTSSLDLLLEHKPSLATKCSPIRLGGKTNLLVITLPLSPSGIEEDHVECPVGVISRSRVQSRGCPLSGEDRKSITNAGRSAFSHKRTYDELSYRPGVELAQQLSRD